MKDIYDRIERGEFPDMKELKNLARYCQILERDNRKLTHEYHLNFMQKPDDNDDQIGHNED